MGGEDKVEGLLTKLAHVFIHGSPRSSSDAAPPLPSSLGLRREQHQGEQKQQEGQQQQGQRDSPLESEIPCYNGPSITPTPPAAIAPPFGGTHNQWAVRRRRLSSAHDPLAAQPSSAAPTCVNAWHAHLL